MMIGKQSGIVQNTQNGERTCLNVTSTLAKRVGVKEVK